MKMMEKVGLENREVNPFLCITIVRK